MLHCGGKRLPSAVDLFPSSVNVCSAGSMGCFSGDEEKTSGRAVRGRVGLAVGGWCPSTGDDHTGSTQETH